MNMSRPLYSIGIRLNIILYMNSGKSVKRGILLSNSENLVPSNSENLVLINSEFGGDADVLQLPNTFRNPLPLLIQLLYSSVIPHILESSSYKRRQTTQSNEKKVIDSDASKQTTQSNEKNVISSDACKVLQVSDDNSVEIIEYASCFSPYKSQLSREFSEEMEKWEKMLKRKRALANVISISDDDEAAEDEVESSEEVDTATSSVSVSKRRRVYHLIDESDED
ncbi:hypothetical protein LXL04_015598 [Taraxacum kok-saghyz]